jgi:hypothetical protein
MRLLASAILLGALAGAAQARHAVLPQADSPRQPVMADTFPTATITIPAGTKIVLALTSPVWANSAKPGDAIYSSAAFPVESSNQIAIPPGTYVQGQIDTLTRPKGRSSRAEFQIHFTKLIFANGYTVLLPSVPLETGGSQDQSVTGNDETLPQIPTAVATVYVDVSSRSDILLDKGTQIEMVLQNALSLNAGSVLAAARRTKPLQIAAVKSATRCQPTPGTPGTSDTVIPGTPGSPGTPDTVIPGGPGMPDTVIPGIPATPGTPPTIIPGSPGTPGTVCPAPPAVLSSQSAKDVHTKTLSLPAAVQIAGTNLSAGMYRLTWKGLGPMALLDLMQKGKHLVSVPARIITLDRRSSADGTTTRNNPDGSVALKSLRFAGENFVLSFDLG